ncbi:protein kinase family protein [Bacillus albus]|uniref:protein kinase family protein n=2 Tax=Bacillaceae TaxID=186817 RepID=UPI000BF090B7|nr:MULTISPECIES: protein kinase family protein [Bacillus cereus group]MDA2218287.1 protein kinase family protein [Bacillus cereus group sp. Bc228]MDA2228750.1 protein kinase family protein [Bacillus cereus group sp. Bc227]MDA2262666.1 protein kinase family protein [Bacillus cereus group sp. Bc200]PEJ38755.1 serine/threonine protein kinase [Bacillus wiedmannii]
MVKPGTVVEFNRIKQFRHIKSLGQGGTGDTHLFKDETTEMLFAFKKYAPKDSDYIDENYERFVDEIKILFTISHPNVVRVYNYYLYPENKLGYLQMEYIDGVSIADFEPFLGKDWQGIFAETISAFEYLESKNILHRDIRPANILIDRHGNVKVIDFGFGKKLVGQDQDGRSVLLNWPVTQLPNETADEGIYSHQSEIYFVGKLFSNIIGEDIVNFKFKYIIDKMIQLNPRERYASFRDISVDISQGVLAINFTEEEKSLYRNFAEILSKYIVKHTNRYEPVKDPNVIMNRLSTLIRNSSLENYIQDNSQLIRCFVDNDYTYITAINIPLSIIVEFYQLLQRLVSYKQKIVLDNIDVRLSKIIIETDFDDLPF